MLLHLGLALLVGAVVAWAWLWPTRWLARVAGAGAGAAALATLAVPLADLLAGRPVEDVLQRPDVPWLLLRLALLALALFFGPELARASRGGRWRPGAPGVTVVLVLTVVLGLTVVLPADGGQGPRSVLAAVLLLAHVLAAAAWFGGLLVLALSLLPRATADAGELALERFARLATTCLAVLALTGVVDALLTTGGPWPLVVSWYGLVLVVKVLVVVAVLVLHRRVRRYLSLAGQRRRQGREPSRGRAHQLRRLVRVVGAEAVLAVAVLGLSAALVALAPLPG
ncbi:Putative copper export protein [Auraticoccus monumenti]|uniref:Putative copper export protein n=1 Tax=Auraticoccus monumenti TaxID=675864 RepID=A0A1G7EI86_9ACTN|nr:Putative copper export protein [Auraticoccus monumenti]